MSFDDFASKASAIVSRAPFFAFCVLAVVIWAPSYFAIGNIDTWQLIINTFTTIITFLMVALLQNSQARSEKAVQQKLNAIANALADFMEVSAQENGNEELACDTTDLRRAVGLEDEVKSSD